MIDLKIFKTFITFLITICLKSNQFVYTSDVLSQDFNKLDTDSNDYYFDLPVDEQNLTDQKLRILYSTHYDIFESKLSDNFTEPFDIKNIRSQLTDPTEIYFTFNGNYLVYESIGFLYIHPLNGKKANTLGLNGDQQLTNIKANSQLNIDWIHDLFYWVKDKKQILVADVRHLNKIVVLANKLYDYITCLAVNPIESFVIWIEFDSEYNEYILYKSFGDGSNRYPFLSFKTHIKRIEFDYQSKRIYYLSTFELSSTTYEGADTQTVVNGPHSIFQMEVLNGHIYWIEYHSNQLFRADLSDFENTQKVITFNQKINRFKLIDYWKQPNGLNRCQNKSCSGICLPVDYDYFRCVCYQQNTCTDNQDIQLVFNDRLVKSISSTVSTTTTTTTTTTTERIMTTTDTKDNTMVDKIIMDPIERIDSLNFNKITDPIVVTEEEPVVTPNDLDYFNIQIKSIGVSPVLITNNTTEDPKVMTNDSKPEVKAEFDINKSEIQNERHIQTEYQNRDKHLIEDPNITDSTVQTFLTNKSNESIFEKKINITDIDPNVTIDELKEFDYHFIPKTLYNPLIYGLILLITGLFIGTILSSIAIKIHGKHNCRSTYSTNTGTANKWDSVGFRKAEQNIYFGAKYTVKDESLY